MAERELYFDEDVSREQVNFLRARGVAVHQPQEVGTLGQIDAVHLGTAASRGWILVTRNRRDFRRLHWMWVALKAWGVQAQPHSGILTVYEGENRPASLDWAQALLDILQQHDDFSGVMLMWRPSTRQWETQSPDFM